MWVKDASEASEGKGKKRTRTYLFPLTPFLPLSAAFAAVVDVERGVQQQETTTIILQRRRRRLTPPEFQAQARTFGRLQPNHLKPIPHPRHQLSRPHHPCHPRQ